MSASHPWARFDYLRTGKAFRCPTPHHILIATRPEEVSDVLRTVDEATARGSWAFGYVSYEAASGLDQSLPGGWSPGQPPLTWFGLCDEPVPIAELNSSMAPVCTSPWWPDWSATEHARAIARIHKYIATGDAYQVNLTDRLRTDVTNDLLPLYAQLALAQRGDHNAYLDLGQYVVASASPELFFEWTGDCVRTRPMKGTAARGRTVAEDRRQASKLRASPKERAENLMIVDLLRNDLGRVARPGGVSVTELFTLERYPTVWQLTSEIFARIRRDVGLVELFRALFPCGSVTGAPKARAMQVISELEASPRGIYCGAIGLVAPPSAAFRARFAVAIRTVVADRAQGQAIYGAGGGITWDSDAHRERAELLTKAAILTSIAWRQP